MPKSAKSKKEKKSKKKHRKNKIEKKEKKDKKSKSKDNDFSIPVELMNSKSHAPETPEQYQERMKRIRREVDPVTGRTRLIRGDSEIIEEIVSKERHVKINKAATEGDGQFFQNQTVGKKN